MAVWTTPPTLEQLNARSQGCAVSHLGIEFTEIGPDYLCARVPVDERNLGVIRPGQQAVIIPDAFPDSAFAATTWQVNTLTS